jgi:hypothetical protein
MDFVIFCGILGIGYRWYWLVCVTSGLVIGNGLGYYIFIISYLNTLPLMPNIIKNKEHIILYIIRYYS